MKSSPRNHPLHGRPDGATTDLTAIAFASVAVLALAGVLVVIAAMPRWSLLLALVAGSIVVAGDRLARFGRLAIPTGTVHVCVPYLGICVEGRVRQTAGMGE